jgi:hypothetical protein
VLLRVAGIRFVEEEELAGESFEGFSWLSQKTKDAPDAVSRQKPLVEP